MTPTGWHRVPSVLEPGRYFMQGDVACAEGAIAAGCDFYAGYPITPASEIMERVSTRFRGMPERVFEQMEDELASIAAVIGAAWAGAKAMTATSGPGLSLMLENLGYAIMTETPLVLVDIQRAGPSTGQATRPAQGDVMQARWGASGDYEIIVLSPWSVADMYWQTIRAFNLSERFRVPVIVLGDEGIGHLREKIEIPGEAAVYDRIRRAGGTPFGLADETESAPPMPSFGDGQKLMVTGSTHDAYGYRRTADSDVHAQTIDRLVNKIARGRGEIVETELHSDADSSERGIDVLLIAYGFTARSALRAAIDLTRSGVRTAMLRLTTLWPFADAEVRAASASAGRVIVPEMNRGQLLREVQRVVPDAKGYNKTNGEVIGPGEIATAVRAEFQ